MYREHRVDLVNEILTARTGGLASRWLLPLLSQGALDGLFPHQDGIFAIGIVVRTHSHFHETLRPVELPRGYVAPAGPAVRCHEPGIQPPRARRIHWPGCAAPPQTASATTCSHLCGVLAGCAAAPPAQCWRRSPCCSERIVLKRLLPQIAPYDTPAGQPDAAVPEHDVEVVYAAAGAQPVARHPWRGDAARVDWKHKIDPGCSSSAMSS
eukprot:scaffold910_cov396-Prasinococcus_capsulatus_cf.AAC.19